MGGNCGVVGHYRCVADRLLSRWEFYKLSIDGSIGLGYVIGTCFFCECEDFMFGGVVKCEDSTSQMRGCEVCC